MNRKFLSYLVLEYFRLCARLQLQKNSAATIIGITGSSGKTSARLAVVQILQTKGIVKHSSHANSQSGIPLNILGLAPTSYSPLDWLRLIILAPWQLLTNHQHFNYYVVEMGIDSPRYPKNMDYLLSIIRPHIALILNAGLTHTANFDYLVKDTNPDRRQSKLIRAVAHEKMKLAHAIDPRGTVVVTIDQKEFKKDLKEVKARQISIGKDTSAKLKIGGVQMSKLGSHFTYSYQGQKLQLVLPDIFSPAYAYTFGGAIAVGAALGVSPVKCIEALRGYRSPAGRMRMLLGIKASTIIDSSYNAAPLATQEALTVLRGLGKREVKIAVLGDMNELGSASKRAHKDLASLITQSCDEVILFGKLTKQYALPLLQEQQFPVHHFTHMFDLIKYLKEKITPHSLVLVKGSQNGILLERAVEAILADSKDVSQLCRRGPYWDKIRRQTK